jgi:hypothetical protein
LCRPHMQIICNTPAGSDGGDHAHLYRDRGLGRPCNIRRHLRGKHTNRASAARLQVRSSVASRTKTIVQIPVHINRPPFAANDASIQIRECDAGHSAKISVDGLTYGQRPRIFTTAPRRRCKVPKLSVVVMLSWLFGALCGYGIAQIFDAGCDQSTEQPDAQ